jgi:hypothetical protein
VHAGGCGNKKSVAGPGEAGCGLAVCFCMEVRDSFPDLSSERRHGVSAISYISALAAEGAGRQGGPGTIATVSAATRNGTPVLLLKGSI